SEPTLAAAAELINANPDVGRLRVIGHTDSDGSARANQQLSEARAQAVVDYLVANGGVDADRLEAEGRGASELLVDPEVTPEDKQRNRRIEWELLS
ncbi:MAG: OmpA family protein, partial [Acidimicrobiia bacterium]|nr:OmpA family protein [Acidimicrobiia bacterium]